MPEQLSDLPPHRSDDAYTAIADGVSGLPVDAETRAVIAALVHDGLADTCPGFTTNGPNRAWLQRAVSIAASGEATGTTLIAQGLAQVPSHSTNAREWLVGRVHDVLVDLVDGFAAGRPNAEWLAAARGGTTAR
jgi:hypothetical protein